MSALEYVLSVPERTLRATAALGGGALAETARLVLPQVVRDSRSYQATVGRLLRIVIELVGGVEGVYKDDMPVSEMAVRKTAGNVIELGGVLAAGWSPLWLLAAAADVTGGTRAYLHTLVLEWKRAGVLPSDVSIDSVEDLLHVLEGTSGTLADAVDMPPLNVADMRTTWQTLREQVCDLPSPDELSQLFGRIEGISRAEGQSLLAVSSALAMGAARAGLHLGDVHIWNYYQQTAARIGREGLFSYVRRIAAPYVGGAGRLFDPHRPTFTQWLLRKGWRR